MQKGASLTQVWSILVKAIRAIEKKLEFVRHEKFGYLTFCPTNIGTGLRASVHVKLPKLAASGRLNDLCNSLGLQARGMHGEHRESEEEEDRGVYDISNKIRIGRSEFDLVISMYDGIKKILNEEYAIK
jgi:creatine kinase